MLTRQEIFALADVKCLKEVLDPNKAVVVVVKTSKRAFDDLKPTAGEWLANSSKEFLVANTSVLIEIKILKERLQLDYGWEKSKFS